MNGFYFITDQALSLAGNRSDVRAARDAGVEIIQYRNKSATTRQMYDEALELKQDAQGAFFIINDRIDIALAVEADGVHIGSGDIPCAVVRRLLGKGKIIGVSVKTAREAQEAQAGGADYVGVGPVFATATKPDAGMPLGISGLQSVRRAVTIPIVAIGGITLDNAPEVINAGANAVCAISAVVGSPEAAAVMRDFQRCFIR
jgi:thiamine-phosphate diphosphorylase